MLFAVKKYFFPAGYQKIYVFNFKRNSVYLSLMALAVKTFNYYVKNGERKRFWLHLNSVSLSVWEIGCMRAVSLSLMTLAVKTFHCYVKNWERKRFWFHKELCISLRSGDRLHVWWISLPCCTSSQDLPLLCRKWRKKTFLTS